MSPVSQGVSVQASGHCMVYTTFPNIEEAKSCARALVEAKLAACVNIVPGVLSIYRWDGGIEEDAEVIAVCKTRRDLVVDVFAAIRRQHPYDTPALAAYDIATGCERYLSWIDEATRE